MRELPALARYHPDGSLDRGFGPAHDGRTTPHLVQDFTPPSGPPPAGEHFDSAALDRAGRLVALTRSGTILRFRPSGGLDTTFGDQGQVAVTALRPSVITVDELDRVLVAGAAQSNPTHALARYTSGGSVDGTFGDGGLVVTTFPGSGSERGQDATAVALDGRGRIIAGGRERLARYTADGDLDPSFGDAGRVGYRRLRESPGHPLGLAVDSRDRVVLAGQRTFDLDGGAQARRASVIRFQSDGTPDLAFGLEGRFEPALDPGGEPIEHLAGLAVDSRDRIVVVAGYRSAARGFVGGIARLTSDGRPDIGFAEDGEVSLRFSVPGEFGPLAAAVDSLDRVVVAGTDGDLGGSRVALARYLPNGALDPNFGGNGKVVTTFGDTTASTEFDALAIDGQGGLCVAASVWLRRGDAVQSLPLLLRYRPAGLPSDTFGHRGKVPSELYFPDESRVEKLTVDRQERILVGASVRLRSRGLRGFALVCYFADGEVDDRFGDGGRVILPQHAPVADMAVDGQDRALVGSHSDDPVGNGRFLITRHRADGSPDEAFGSGGTVVTDFRTTTAEEITAMAVTRQNGVIVGGWASTRDGGRQFALARYRQDGELDAGFGGDGKVLTDLPLSSTESVSHLAVDSRDQVVVGGWVHPEPGREGQYLLARFDVTGALDPDFGGAGTVLTVFRQEQRDHVTALAIDPTDRILLGGWGSGDQFAVARYRPDGVLDATFGGAGRVDTDIPGRLAARLQALAIDGAGRIIAAGTSTGPITLPGGLPPAPSRAAFSVVRYLPDGQLDVHFGRQGRATTFFGSPFPPLPFPSPAAPVTSATVHAVAIDRFERIVAGGYTTTTTP